LECSFLYLSNLARKLKGWQNRHIDGTTLDKIRVSEGKVSTWMQMIYDSLLYLITLLLEPNE
jgi:hypothetical protein